LIRLFLIGSKGAFDVWGLTFGKFARLEGLDVCCLLFVVWRLLFVVCCLLFIVCCLLLDVYCWMFVVGCLLLDVWGLDVGDWVVEGV
jgi:hypothetical protein